MLKLLQATAPELRQILVFIWTKILALDRSCQVDLVKDDGYTYFIRFLQSSNVPVEERAMAAFILAVICDDHKKGQTVCMSSGLMEICLENIKEAALPDTGSPFFLRWLCLCLGKLWEDNPEGQKAAVASRRTNCWRVCPLILLRTLGRRLRMRLVHSFWSKRPTTPRIVEEKYRNSCTRCQRHPLCLHQFLQPRRLDVCLLLWAT